tara:strand:- start:4996 stop:6657 length:1662 start_codon:yes stop_codon:yes gene_type:complete
MANELPQGFTLDNKAQALPQGFTIDQPSEVQNDVNSRGVNDSIRPVPTSGQSSVIGEATIGEDLLGGAEVAGTILSSAIAEPIAGLSGIVSALFGDTKSGADTVNLVKDALTFEPRTKEGKAKLKAVGDFVAPVGEKLGQIESFLGNSVLDATGSPELAAIAHSLPTAALELLGVKGLKGAKLKNTKLSSNVAEAIQQAAPDLQTIKQATSSAYKELDNLGVKIKPQVFDRFSDGLQSKLSKEGLNLNGPSEQLFPKSSSALKTIIAEKGLPKTAGELETLRKVATGAAKSIDPPDARLGTIIVDEIDSALDSLSNEIGGKFKEARGLAQRGFKSQSIQDMIENASHTASGMENGLRIEARKLLKNKKKRRGFSQDEITALKQIEQGTTAANAAKFLGKFGISEGQATSMLGVSIGAGGGGAIGSMFGPVGAAAGAITIPALGQIAKNTAQRLTLNSTKFADDLARSGKNAKAITRAYLKHTPVSKRSVSDLTDLFLDNNLNVDDIKSLPKSSGSTAKLVDDAKFFATELRRRAQQSASAGLIATPSIPPEDN